MRRLIYFGIIAFAAIIALADWRGDFDDACVAASQGESVPVSVDEWNAVAGLPEGRRNGRFVEFNGVTGECVVEIDHQYLVTCDAGKCHAINPPMMARK